MIAEIQENYLWLPVYGRASEKMWPPDVLSSNCSQWHLLLLPQMFQNLIHTMRITHVLLGWDAIDCGHWCLQFRIKFPTICLHCLFFLDCLWPPDGWASKPALLSKNPPGSSISASELKGSPLDHHKICKVYRQVFCIIATNWSEWTRDLQNWWLKWMHGIWAFNQTRFNP